MRSAKPDAKGLWLAARRTNGPADLATPLVTFLLGAAVSAFLFLQNPYFGRFETYRLINCGALLFAPLVAVLLLLNQNPIRFGLARGDARLGWRWTGICYVAMLPILIYTATRPEFQTYYGIALAQALGWGAPYAFSAMLTPHLYPLGLAYYELGNGFYMFCWEFFFRGFLLFGLARARFLGWAGAILIQTIPFTLLHWSLVPSASKPAPEIASAFFGGILLGILAWRTRSFVYGFLIHWAIAITLDLLLIVPFLAHQARP